MIMVHAPAAEKKAVQDGWATRRTLSSVPMKFIVGPASDPAKIAQAKDALDAYACIAQAKASFSPGATILGTHKKSCPSGEKAEIKPGGDWGHCYQGFIPPPCKGLRPKRGSFYDRQQHLGRPKKRLFPDLRHDIRGDKMLVNTYHALAQPAGATPGAGAAAEFIDFVKSARGRQIIRDYGKEKIW